MKNWKQSKGIISDDTRVIASVNTHSISETKAIEISKLIAAAPDLLKAAIKLSEAISRGEPHLLSEGNFELKVAIKKAIV